MKRFSAKLFSVMCVVALFCSLFTVAAPSAYALAGAYKNGDGKIYAWGCDMSKWNVEGDSVNLAKVDFAKMKADGCDFVILRIGDEKAAYNGVRKADPAFIPLYNAARAAGLHIGAYYYSYRTTSAGVLGDVQFCLDILNNNDLYFEYPIYFDIEADVHYNLSASKQVELCNTWCDAMVEAGYFPGVYSNLGCAMDNLQASSSFQYDTWVPKPLNSESSGTQYDPNVDKIEYRSKYGMWQYKWYSDSWSEPSYEGSYWYDSKTGWPLDCNVAFRDYPTIMQTYGYNNVVTKHTITFETNGGSAVDPIKVTDGEGFSEPTAPTKYAFTFAGWYCNPELTDPYTFGTPVPYDFTLYAKWNEADWSINNNLMPNSQQLVLNSFDENGGAIWPYWNDDAYSSVTMYNGVTNDDNWSWPSAYMAYENSFDAVNNGYLYVKKDGTAQFNVVLTYLDKDGGEQEVYLNDVAKVGSDFPAGALEDFYDVGSYIRNLGHAPASGKVKFTKVTYFVVGPLDSYVKLYDLKFTSKFDLPDAYKTMMNSNVTQLSGEGRYVYDNGTLTMNATGAEGYSLKMTIGETINPTELTKLLMDVTATAPFNVSVELTNGNGDATMQFKNEFFNVFEMETALDAIPAGDYNVNMNLIGYYEWNGGAITESQIKSVTVTLTQPGTLTLSALQAARIDTVTYVQDGAYSDGSLSGKPDDTLMGDVNGDGQLSTQDVRLIMSATVGGDGVLTEEQLAVADYNGDGTVNTQDARAILMGLTQ